MFVGLGRYDLRLPACGSLKDKRSVVRSLVAVLRKKFNASIAEVDHRELTQRAALAVSVVADTGYHVKRILHQVERHVGAHPGVEMIDATVDLLAPED